MEPDELPDWERAATNTVSWLAEEGFLRYKAAAYGGYVGVRLSMKGLTVLGYIPLSIKSTETAEPLIVRLKRAVGKGVEGAATDAIKDVLGQVFGLCVRYVVSADKSPGVTVRGAGGLLHASTQQSSGQQRRRGDGRCMAHHCPEPGR